MEDCKPNATPLEVGYQNLCILEDCPRANQKQYQSLIGSLLYLAMTTRPDIALSSTEAEYVALSTAAKEAAYVLKLIS
ncbi:hypothetical protein KR074_000972, partial [Drosophila pseudoananassae]